MTEDNIKEYERLKAQKKKQLDRQNEYARLNYDRIGFTVPKGQKQAIVDHFRGLGYENMTEYIVALIKKDMEQDGFVNE